MSITAHKAIDTNADIEYNQTMTRNKTMVYETNSKSMIHAETRKVTKAESKQLIEWAMANSVSWRIYTMNYGMVELEIARWPN
jgi:phage-related protein